MTIQWVRSTETYVNPDNSYWPLVLYGASNTGSFGRGDPVTSQLIQYPFAWAQFETVDVKPYGVSADATHIDIGGIEIITGAADLFLTFRAPGSTLVNDWTWYQEQLLSAATSGGCRNVAYDNIPLVNGCFEYAANAKNYPDDGNVPGIGSPNSVGWNLKLKKWHR